MQQQNAWCYFDNAPRNICDDPIVADACFRGASLRILSRDAATATVEYKGHADNVPTAGIHERRPPLYTWGDSICIVSRNAQAKVVDVCWHYKEKCFFYYLETPDGTPIKKRYFEHELQKVSEHGLRASQ